MGRRCTMKKWYSLKLLILIWVCCFVQKGAVFASDSDKSALLEFKNSISDPSGVLSSWDSISNSDHCSWYGVSCDSNHFVIALNVTGGGGGGDFPPSNSCARISGFPLYGYGIKRSCSNFKSSIHGKLSSTISKLAELRILSLPFNELSGEIPDEIWGMEKLEVLDLEGNLISGLLPIQFKGIRKLRVLNLGFNQIVGNIPNPLFIYTTLEILNLAGNQLNGSMPNSWFRNLKGLYLSFNQLTGSIPSNIGLNCKNLESLELSGNYLTGEIPHSLGNCTSLRSILLYSNSLVELIPSEFGLLSRLEVLDLSRNSLSGAIPPEIGNCKNLRYLDLSSNTLTGQVSDKLPVSCMNLFDISSNSLSGPIPNILHNHCSNIMPVSDDPSYMFHFAQKIQMEKIPIEMNLDYANQVVVHNFGGNYFTGPLQSLPIAPNRQSQTVYVFSMANNNISGPVPLILFEKCGEFSSLIVNISKNMFTGRILDVECSSLRLLDASWNQIIGTIPSSIGKLKGLKILSLSGNKLTGLIPVSMTRLTSLEVLDMSSNFLTGEIPKDLVNLRNLTVLRLNNNKLSGQIPSGLSKLLVFNVLYNNLSGPSDDNLVTCNNVPANPACHMFSLTSSSSTTNQPGFIEVSENLAATTPPGGSLNSIEIALISSSAAIFSVLVVLFVLFLYTRKCSSGSRSQVDGGSVIVRNEVTVFEKISVPLNFENVVNATGNFNVSNCIGNGGFGATYKAEIAPGVLLAIKRLAVGRFQGLQQFDAEIKTLGMVRHPNLVTLIGYHASRNEMFLIYNYLSGGNLERFIQERSTMAVNWIVLHKIALDVARALEYLHDRCEPRVLHRDVKPSNILLDEDFNAYLSDFGLARLLGISETHATTGVAGTFGYVAPEYALTNHVTRKADVYSYGVVLLELISDKKALDPSFSPYGNGFNIVTWANMLLRQGRRKEFFTAGLWESGPHDDLVELLHLAVQCTVDSLLTRPMMNFVVRRLKRFQPPSY